MILSRSFPTQEGSRLSFLFFFFFFFFFLGGGGGGGGGEGGLMRASFQVVGTVPVDQLWLLIRSRKRFAPGLRCFSISFVISIRSRSLLLLYLFQRFFKLSEGQAFGPAWVKASTSCVLEHSPCLGPDIFDSVS